MADDKNAASDHHHRPEFKFELNLNTIMNFIGFVGVIITLVTLWNAVSFRVDNHDKMLSDLKAQMANATTTLRSLREADVVTEAKVQQVESGLKTLIERIDRYLSENDRSFIEVRREMGTIATQNEVLKQILTRIEAQQLVNGNALHMNRGRVR